MILTLLQTIAKEAREQAESDTGKLDKLLEERLDFHLNKLSGITEERRKERDTLLKEKSKQITMDDLHEGFESKVSWLFFLRSGNPFNSLSTVRSRKTRTFPGDNQGNVEGHLQDHSHRSAQPGIHLFFCTIDVDSAGSRRQR